MDAIWMRHPGNDALRRKQMNGFNNALVTIVVAALTCSAAEAHAESYRFVQARFDEGALLSGEFVGEDANGDGLLTVETLPGGLTGNGPPTVTASELASFNVRFSGNTAVGGLSLDLSSIFATQFGIPCCGPGEPYAFYFDLADPERLEFVAMSADELVMMVGDSAFGSAALVGEACNFRNGGGNCAARSGAPYAPQVSAVPLPPSWLLLLPALGALPLSSKLARARSPFAAHRAAASGQR